jgi:hypothetical protein
MFEAGAITKRVEKGRVCPILFGMRTADFKGPLSHFQAAEFGKEEFRGVVNTINKALEKPLGISAEVVKEKEEKPPEKQSKRDEGS